jgi:hypothetical protein
MLPPCARRSDFVPLPNRGCFTRGQGFARARSEERTAPLGGCLHISDARSLAGSGRQLPGLQECGGRSAVCLGACKSGPTDSRTGWIRPTGPTGMYAAVSRRPVRTRIPQCLRHRRRRRAGVGTAVPAPRRKLGSRRRCSIRRPRGEADQDRLRDNVSGESLPRCRTDWCDAPSGLAAGTCRPDLDRHRGFSMGCRVRIPRARMLARSSRPAGRRLVASSLLSAAIGP